LRVLIVSQAPSQWQCPLFRFLAREDDLELEVAFVEPTTPLDPELGSVPPWGEHGSRDGFLSTDLPGSRRSLIKWAMTTARRQDLDVVVLPGWGLELARIALLATFASGRARRRTVIFTDATDLTERDSRRLYVRAVVLRSLGRAGLHFGVTGNAARKHLVGNGVKEQSIIVMPYVVDNDRIAADTAMWRLQRDALRSSIAGVDDPDAPIFLTVVKLVQREGPERVIRSFLFAATERPSARLVVVGDGRDRAPMERLCRQPGGDRVIFAGYQPYAELPRFYAAADWFVHLPDLEPWGVSVNEAVASSLPLLCSTRVGATQDLLEDGINGILVSDGAAAAQAGFRQALAMSPAALGRLSAASLQISNRVHFRRWAEALRTLSLQEHEESRP
jgi:glycosyltransferase involved in cell wall biosynthesis